MLTEKEQFRYARQLAMPYIGERGQEKLKESHVLVAGVGGLGCLSSFYLTCLGIGHLMIIDHGSVQLSDLNRQILYNEKDVGLKKADVAYEKLSLLNSDILIESICEEITSENILSLMKQVQVVIDGTDNFEARLILNKACFEKRIPYIYGGIFGFKGKMTTFIPGKTPCIKCLYPKKEEVVPVIPVVGPIPGLIATLQVLEALKLILGLGDSLAGRLLSFNGETMVFSYFDIKKRPGCRICSA
jgi:molybdopterin/thiamine biosynthesis adenylyltransferase